MKKITAAIFALVLAFCLLPVSAFAVGALPQPDSAAYGIPQPDSYYTGSVGWTTSDGMTKEDYTLSSAVSAPAIASQPSDVTAAIGSTPAVLSVGVSGSASSVRYQWYAVDVADLGAFTAIPGANGAEYSPAQTPGTTYYCVGVYSVVGSLRSEEVMSAVAAVSYSGVEIISLPSKTSYNVGDSISLKGLVVRVYAADGSYWDSRDGQGLNVYPAKAEIAGQTAVEVSYGISSATYYVSVASTATSKDGKTADGEDAAATDENHVHEYDDWVVTKEANCVTTGLRSHTCTECGDTQTEAIPKTDHTWDAGVITKQPTETTNGSRLYTCTVCKANRSEIIAAGTDTSGQQAGLSVGAASATAAPAGTVGGGNEVAGVSNTGANNTGVVNKNTDSSGWWLIPVSALVLVGCGSGAYYLMKKKGSEE